MNKSLHSRSTQMFIKNAYIRHFLHAINGERTSLFPFIEKSLAAALHYRIIKLYPNDTRVMLTHTQRLDEQLHYFVINTTCIRNAISYSRNNNAYIHGLSWAAIDGSAYKCRVYINGTHVYTNDLNDTIHFYQPLPIGLVNRAEFGFVQCRGDGRGPLRVRFIMSCTYSYPSTDEYYYWTPNERDILICQFHKYVLKMVIKDGLVGTISYT